MLRRLHAEQPEHFAFTQGNLDWAKGQIAKYPEGRQASAVIPLLWRAQEQEGWISEKAIEAVAELLGMAKIRVLEVATFYFMFQLRPVGSVAHVQVCGTTSCMICGAEDLMAVCKDKIAAQAHELSADGRFSWEEVECLGACANAPMVQIGKDYYEDLTAESFGDLLDAFARGEVPAPGSRRGRFASEPATGLTSLKEGTRGFETNASVTLALRMQDTIKRITGDERPVVMPEKSEDGSLGPKQALETAEATDVRHPDEDMADRPTPDSAGDPKPGGGGEPKPVTKPEPQSEAKPAEPSRSLAKGEVAGEPEPLPGAKAGNAGYPDEDASDEPAPVTASDAQPGSADGPERVERPGPGPVSQPTTAAEGSAEVTPVAAPTSSVSTPEPPAPEASPSSEVPEASSSKVTQSEPPHSRATAPVDGSAEPVPAAVAERAGEKPETLDAPRGGQADDLKQIRGVGPKLEQMLHSMGFYHFDQIAAWTPAEVAWVDSHLEGFKGRVTRDGWVDQAKLLSGGGETDFSRRVEDGDVY
jgi:NADH-quinone oxidoreductase subunit E